MSTTYSIPDAELGNRDGGRQLASTLLHNSPTQVGTMVTTIAMVGQAAAQFHETVSLYAAFLFACLLATYQVWLVQKATVRECFIMVPIAGLILFALALATNNSIAPPPPPPDTASLQKELDLANAELELRKKQIENATELINEFRRTLGLPSNTSLSPQGTSDRSNAALGKSMRAKSLSNMFGAVVGQAYAQLSDQEAERKRQLMEALSQYETQQQELKQKEQRLQEKEKRLREEQQQTQQAAPLWRKW